MTGILGRPAMPPRIHAALRSSRVPIFGLTARQGCMSPGLLVAGHLRRQNRAPDRVLNNDEHKKRVADGQERHSRRR